MRRRTLNFGVGILLAAPMAMLVKSRVVQAQDGVNVAKAMERRVIGDPNAKIGLVEYFSLTCSHCAHFHVEIYPKLKETYIDTGKVKMELRDFPLDQWALRAAAMARCVPPKHYVAMIDVLMKQQSSWAQSDDVLESLLRIGQLAGLKRDFARACMTNGNLLDAIIAMRLEGNKKYDVSSTPSFLLNGEKVSAFEFDDFEKLLARAGV